MIEYDGVLLYDITTNGDKGFTDVKLEKNKNGYISVGFNMGRVRIYFRIDRQNHISIVSNALDISYEYRKELVTVKPAKNKPWYGQYSKLRC